MKEVGKGAVKKTKMNTKKEEQLNLTLLFKVVPALFSAVSFLGGIIIALITASLWFSKNVATVQYVDQRHDEMLKLVRESIDSLTKYADRMGSDVRQQSFDHSDMNKKDMMNEIKTQGSDIKALGAKQDIMLDSVRTIQNQMFESRKR